jgi:hypothetical protein
MTTVQTVTVNLDGKDLPIPVVAVKWTDERRWCKRALECSPKGACGCANYASDTPDTAAWCALNGDGAKTPCVFDVTGDPIWDKIERNRPCVECGAAYGGWAKCQWCGARWCRECHPDGDAVCPIPCGTRVAALAEDGA